MNSPVEYKNFKKVYERDVWVILKSEVERLMSKEQVSKFVEFMKGKTVPLTYAYYPKDVREFLELQKEEK